jgi:hypothetical protein
VNAPRAKAARRCVSLSSALVQCWNGITATRIALERHDQASAERSALTARLHDLCAQQDQLEGEMTAAAERWAKILAASSAAGAKGGRALRSPRTARPAQLQLGEVA